jgi:hypothetical protein
MYAGSKKKLCTITSVMKLCQTEGKKSESKEGSKEAKKEKKRKSGRKYGKRLS